MSTKIQEGTRPILNVEDTPDDIEFKLPNFSSAEEAQAWLDPLPRGEAEVDERLKRRIPVTMNLHQFMMDGFNYLAERKGIGSGKNLIPSQKSPSD